ncbi:MAG: hypothetical protein ABSC22_16930 [Roseiarcus sp.]|jgi:hypothetical protein
MNNEEQRLTKRSKSNGFRSELKSLCFRFVLGPVQRRAGVAERTILPITGGGEKSRRNRNFL